MTRAINDSLLPGTKKLSKLAKREMIELQRRRSRRTYRRTESYLSGTPVSWPNKARARNAGHSKHRIRNHKAEPLGLV